MKGNMIGSGTLTKIETGNFGTALDNSWKDFKILKYFSRLIFSKENPHRQWKLGAEKAVKTIKMLHKSITSRVIAEGSRIILPHTTLTFLTRQNSTVSKCVLI